MPIVGKKKYPYTPAGRAAAKKAAVGLGRASRRAPAATAKMKTGMKRASAKRKAGKGYRK
jgi:hypothetical protein